MKQNERKRSKSYEYFDHTDESPEDLAKTLLTTPTKKKSEWRYLKKFWLVLYVSSG